MKMENKLLSLDTPLFEGITQQDRRPMLDCITYHTAVFSKGEIIAFEQENMKHIGIVLSGAVDMIKEDLWGNKTLLVRMRKNELFGETFACGNDSRSTVTFHVETVVLLSQQKADDYIEVELELDELDLTSAESKATYKEIQEYVLKEHGLKVSNLYISQVKRKCGIEVGENYNLPKSEDSRQPQCPEEKEKAIKDALEHFGMV